ncbi:MAG: hypothetical protein AB1497_02555 [Bacillota bacterium]
MRRSTIYITLVILVLAASLTGCLKEDAYEIRSVAAEPAEVAAGSTTTITVEVGKAAGRQQVQHTDTVSVKLSAPEGLTVTPVILGFEEDVGDNTLRIVMRPGAVLPRSFTFEVTIPPFTPKGEIKLTATMQFKARTDTREVIVLVK